MMNTLIMSDIIDNMPPILKLISDGRGEVNRYSLIMLRIVIVLICMVIAICSNSVVAVLDIAGSIFSPIGSFIVPVSCCHARYSCAGHIVSRKASVCQFIE